MKYLLTSLLALSSLVTSAQTLNKKVEDSFKHKQVMLNQCTRDSLTSFPEFKDSYDIHYNNYTVDSTTIAQLKKLTKGIKMKVVLGTWCGDSKLQVPHFFRLTDALSIAEKNIDLISVNGEKKAENGLLDGLAIERVPTFIFFDKKGIEIGRITESPKKTFEADMLQILAKKK